MRVPFNESLRKLRTEQGLSQQQLADKMYVDRSTIVKWESGSRLPDAAMISRLSAFFAVDVSTLLSDTGKTRKKPLVILVDDERIILQDSVQILKEALPDALITAFDKPSEAIAFAKQNRVSLAFLDIEMGKHSGLALCKELLEINPFTNVVYITGYMEYSFEAWSTGASGFMLKPLSVDAVRNQLSMLRYPIRG